MINDIAHRDEFTSLINSKGYKVCAEIGLGRGLYALHLLENSNLDHLYSFENWGSRWAKKVKDKTLNKFVPHSDRFKLMEGNAREEIKNFPDGFFDFVYVDGYHKYKYVKRDIEACYPKVRIGGFFGGHDYIENGKYGVVRAANEFFSLIGREFNVTREESIELDNPSFWMIK